jgi:hypothetical protein
LFTAAAAAAGISVYYYTKPQAPTHVLIMHLFLPSVLLIFLATGASTEIVNTTFGPVEGKTIQTDDGTFVNSWYGIRFAAPPIGKLRFEVGR